MNIIEELVREDRAERSAVQEATACANTARSSVEQADKELQAFEDACTQVEAKYQQGLLLKEKDRRIALRVCPPLSDSRILVFVYAFPLKKKVHMDY